MKTNRWIGFILTVFVPFLMTSCRVNWDGHSYRVPWWIIAVPIILLLLGVWILEGKHLASRRYVCQGCYRSFSPKWWKAAFSAHMGDAHALRCPHCGKKGLCPPEQDGREG